MTSEELVDVRLGDTIERHYAVEVDSIGRLRGAWADLDRFWFQRSEAADTILDNLDQLSASFVSVAAAKAPEDAAAAG